MLRILLIYMFAIGSQEILTAADPAAHVEKQKNLYLADVEKADRELSVAKRKREERVMKATKAYIKELEKVKVYYTKKGKLEKALEYDKQIKDLQKWINSGKADSIPIDSSKKTDPVLSTVTDSKSQSQRLNMSRIVGRWKFPGGGSLTFQSNGSVKSSWDKDKRTWKYVRNNEYLLYRKQKGVTLEKLFRISENGNTLTIVAEKKTLKRVAK